MLKTIQMFAVRVSDGDLKCCDLKCITYTRSSLHIELISNGIMRLNDSFFHLEDILLLLKF